MGCFTPISILVGHITATTQIFMCFPISEVSPVLGLGSDWYIAQGHSYRKQHVSNPRHRSHESYILPLNLTGPQIKWILCVSWFSHTSTNTTFFPKPPTTFLTCFSRRERRKNAGKKVSLNRVSNS